MLFTKLYGDGFNGQEKDDEVAGGYTKKINTSIFIILVIISCSNRLSIVQEKKLCVTIMCLNDEKEYYRINEMFQKKSLKSYSGLEFLNELKKIKCSMITIENNCVPKNWIKKKDLKDIFNKVLSRELCPGSAIMVRDFVLLCLILFDFGL